MDALSSMSSIGGYKASLIAANDLGKYFPMMTTAAGTTRPAKVLILGAGVAGLQAIATCRRLGAEVTAFDIRPEVKEQVESLGAAFLEEEQPAAPPAEEEDFEEEPPTLMDRLRDAFGLPPKEKVEADGAAEPREEEQEQVSTSQGYAREQAEEKQRRDRELIKRFLGGADVVLTTALVPGRPAPKLLTEDMVDEMPPGSVVVDLAAEHGGNVEGSVAGEERTVGGVLLIGARDVPSQLPAQASDLYAANVLNLLLLMVDAGALRVDLGDDVLGACCVTHGGTVVHEPTRQLLTDDA
jgi:NAD(P) transhydrogenase subunit alpha